METDESSMENQELVAGIEDLVAKSDELTVGRSVFNNKIDQSLIL